MARIAFYSKVVSIESHIREVYDHGIGEEARFRHDNLGYFMLLEGSYEALHIGFTTPVFKIGDRVKITIEKV